MKNTWAVFSREFRSFFVSPVAYGVILIFLAIAGFFFFTQLSNFLHQSMQALTRARYYQQTAPTFNINLYIVRPVLHNFGLIILFMIPGITMKLFAEEKKTGTIELLLTSPITNMQIIFGKFFAGLALYTIMLIPTVVYMAILFIWGNPEIAPIITGYIGLLLVGASFLAVGLFISALTENQIVAFSVSFGILMLLYVISWNANFSGEFWSSVFSYISITGRFDDFTKGIIDTKNIVFYLSFIGFGLFLTYRAVESMKWRA